MLQEQAVVVREKCNRSIDRRARHESGRLRHGASPVPRCPNRGAREPRTASRASHPGSVRVCGINYVLRNILPRLPRNACAASVAQRNAARCVVEQQRSALFFLRGVAPFQRHPRAPGRREGDGMAVNAKTNNGMEGVPGASILRVLSRLLYPPEATSRQFESARAQAR